MGFPLMERVVYEQMAELDQRHWWYRARRKVLAALIKRLANPPKGAAILEIGCGTGHNLSMLGEFGQVDALELDEEARSIAEGRLGKKALSAPLPELKGVKLRHYDLIGAFDVIEHISDDSRRPRLDRQAAQARRQAGHHRPRRTRGCGRRTTSSIITNGAIRSGD